MTDPTRAVYETRALEWREQRAPRLASPDAELGPALSERAAHPGGAPLVDLGCGPGWHSALLGRRAIALDSATAMLELVPEHAPHAARIAADLADLPFRKRSLGGALASKSYVHIPRRLMPLALHDLHRSVEVGAPVSFVLFAGDAEHDEFEGDRFAGRRFSLWPPELLRCVLDGAGFTIDEWSENPTRRGDPEYIVRCTRARTLADTVGPDMRMLVVGLNPSMYAADAGVGFARPGNRFWPALLATGLAERDRDPVDALTVHGIGMTDLVKRATSRADALQRSEYEDGLERLERLVRWLQPGVVCLVGLAGWRSVVDPGATPGLQSTPLGDRPVYLMPSTSGANAHSSLADLTQHLRTASTTA